MNIHIQRFHPKRCRLAGCLNKMLRLGEDLGEWVRPPIRLPPLAPYRRFTMILLSVRPQAAQLRRHLLIRVNRRRCLSRRRRVQGKVARPRVQQTLDGDLSSVCPRHLAHVLWVLQNKTQQIQQQER